MLSSAVRTFTDPEEYGASIRAAQIELTITGRGQYAAKLIRVDLHRLWLQRFSESLPRIVHVACMPGRAFITFRTQAGPAVVTDGAEYLPSNIIRHSERQSYYARSFGPAAYGTMSLTVEEMAAVGSTIVGLDVQPPRNRLILTPAASAMTRLQRLHAAAGRVAEEAPEIIAHPEAARSLEHSLIHAMVNCLVTREVQEDRAASRRHAAIMRRFYATVEATPERALYLTDICRAVGVAERTLQRCCNEQLGIGPNRFLLLRRMQLASRRLRESNPTTTTVTKIATQLGFWELGRFAVAYKSLFGESPSATLRRPPDFRQQPAREIPRILAEIA